MEWFHYLGRSSSSSRYSRQFDVYLEEKGFESARFMELVNKENVILLLIFIILIIASYIYFLTMSLAVITKAVLKKKISSFTSEANRFLLRFIGINIIIILIFMTPILLVTLSAFLGFISPVFAVISIIIVILLSVFYIIYIVLRLFFAVAAMFIDDAKPVESIKKVFTLSKNRKMEIFIVAVVIIAAGFLANSLIGQPMYDTFSSSIFGGNVAKAFISFVVYVFLAVLHDITSAFITIFTLYAYVDFKSKEGKKNG